MVKIPLFSRLLVLLVLGLASTASALEVPFLQGRVNDLAEMLDSGVEQRLEAKLAALEQATGAQVAVLTIPSLEGDSLEDFSLRVVETWQLGRADVDDGLLLLVARDDRKIRIEVGYGLEGTLTDVQSRRIISGLITPSFREGDFGGGIERAIDAVDGTIRGQEGLIPPEAAGDDLATMSWPEKILFLGVFSTVVGLFSFVGAATSGCGGWFLYFFLMPFYFAFPGAIFGFEAGVGALVLWILTFPVLRYFMAKTDLWKKLQTSSGRGGWTISTGGGGWSGGGFSGGGFSGGGFSGGGGSFGGGGSSGGW